MGERVSGMNAGKRKKLRGFQGKRILWVNPAPPDVFLYQASSLEMLRHMAERQCSIVLITTRSRNVARLENPSRARIVSVPLRFVPLLSSVMFAIWLFLFLPIYIIVLKPDFVIATQPEASILVFIPNLLFSKIKKVRFVLDVRSIPVETAGFRGFQRRLWFNASILVAKKLFDGMTIITSLMRKEICNTFEIDIGNVGIWSSGVNTRLFNPESCASDGAKLKRKLGLSGRFIVFYHGVFTANRGLEETVESIKTLRPDYSDVVLFLLGTGPTATKLKYLVQKEGLQEQVVVHDPVDHTEVPKFIEMSDVCIVPLPDHPYWRFQSPLKLLEYLAMEKVVIVTDIPAHRTVIDEKKCGIYISSIAPIEIAESIVYAYDNKEKLVEWGKTGRTIVNERYTWGKVAEDLENYLLSIDDPSAR
jgi:glycosyltransferase involved in cell wall biosynthesis